MFYPDVNRYYCKGSKLLTLGAKYLRFILQVYLLFLFDESSCFLCSFSSGCEKVQAQECCIMQNCHKVFIALKEKQHILHRFDRC